MAIVHAWHTGNIGGIIGVSMLAILLIALSIVVIAANYFGIIRWLLFRTNYSSVPLFGGLLGMFGMILVPAFRSVAWIPIIVDPGSTVMMVMLIGSLMKNTTKRP